MPPPRKFRVAVREEGEWTIHEPPHPFLLCCDGKSLLHKSECDNPPTQVDPLFSTGLLDAEGTEIYAGDVFLLPDSPRYADYDLKPFVVEYSVRYGGWIARWKPNFFSRLDRRAIQNESHWIVRGTKYTDPHLLEPDDTAQ